MPTLSRACQHPRCPAPAERLSVFCSVHKPRPDDMRPSAARRGYDRGWRRTSARFLREYPTCFVCGNPAKEVDHIKPLVEGGTNQFTNLQSLCKSCHSKKTIRQNRGENGQIMPRGGGG